MLHLLHALLALGARAVAKIAQHLRMHLIMPALHISACQKHHGAGQHGRQAHRPRRKARPLAQKRQRHGFILGKRAVCQQAQPVALRQFVLRLQHGIHAVERNDLLAGLRVDGRQNGVELVGVFTVHQHVHRLPVLLAQRLERLETAEVRAQNDHALPLLQHALQGCAICICQPDVDLPMPPGQQKHPVVNDAGKGEEVAIQLAPGGATLPQPLVVSLQGRARPGRKQQEIPGNAAQHHAAGRSPQQQRQPHHEAHHGALAALLALRPFGMRRPPALAQRLWRSLA